MATKVSTVEREFVMGQIASLGLAVRIHGTGKTIVCKLADVQEDRLCFLMNPGEASSFSGWERITAYVDFHGQPLCFGSKVRKIEGGRIFVESPELLIKSPQRKNVRVPGPKGCSLSFYLNDGNIPLDYPRSGEYSDVEKPDSAASFDSSSFEGLIGSFRTNAMGFCTEFRIVMFKERKPERLEEKLLAKYGRVLFVPSVKTGLPSSDPYPEGRIITRQLEEDYEGITSLTEGSEFERLLAMKSEAGYIAELWCPILYFQYVIGYVYMATKLPSGGIFDFNHVEYVWDFARFIAFFLKSHSYFKAEGATNPVAYGASIVDMSVSGCQITIPRTSLGMSIKLGSLIKLRLDQGIVSMTIKGKAVRKFDDKENDYYGISFGGLPLEDQARLFGLLYSRPFDANAIAENETVFLVSGKKP
ncbi:MAG: PilZ domain-containing protein [Spirochaetes bacterium]|nr:PilZ domain-containing protein [Spirochaetota bacterium]